MPTDSNTVVFPSKEAKEMAVRGLNDLKYLFKMRLNEAYDCNDVNAYEQASKELTVVMQTLVALES